MAVNQHATTKDLLEAVSSVAYYSTAWYTCLCNNNGRAVPSMWSLLRGYQWGKFELSSVVGCVPDGKDVSASVQIHYYYQKTSSEDRCVIFAVCNSVRLIVTCSYNL